MSSTESLALVQPAAGGKNKGGRPRKPVSADDVERVLGSEAGQAAMQAIVERTLQTMMGTRAAAAPTDGAPLGPAASGDMAFAEKLAISIAEIADGNQKRKRVPPETLALWRRKRLELVDRLAEAKARGERPEYRVVYKTYLEEVLIEPFRLDPASKQAVPQEILWNGIPNESMRPINQPAVEIYTLYMESVGGPTHRTKNSDNRGMAVTPGGLVIKGLSNPRRTVANLADSNVGSNTDRDPFGLSFKTQFDPTLKEVHVLGTVAEPARQNYFGAEKHVVNG